MLTIAPPDAVYVGSVHLAALRSQPFYRIISAAIADIPGIDPALTACGADPLARVDTLGFWSNAAGDVIIALRGALAAPDQSACVEAIGRALFNPAEAPLSIARARDTVLVGMTDQAAMQRVLDGQSPHAGTNPRHAAAAALTQGAAVRVSLDLAATSEAERAALLVDLFSVPSERAAQWSSSLQSAGLRVDADGQRGLTLAMNVLARDPAIVTELVPAVRTSIGRWLGQLREGLDEVNRQFASTPLWSPEEFADARTLLTRVAEGTQTESEGPRATLRIALAPEGVTALTSYAQRSYTRYQQLLAEIEVSTLANEIAHLVGAYATTPERPNARPRGRLPASAPRVPAEVPRGTFVRLTPDAWSHPAWRAIGFAPAVLTRTRASYEVEVRGTRFTVRGLTDLDGDGTPSTFEQSGRLDARRQPQYDAPRTVNAAH